MWVTFSLYHHRARVYSIGDISGDVKGSKTGKNSSSFSIKFGVAYFAIKNYFDGHSFSELP